MKKKKYKNCKFPQYINPKLDTFYDCWWYLLETAFYLDHNTKVFDDIPSESMFLKSLDIDVVKVDPKTNCVDFYRLEKNTKTRVWLESGEQWFDDKFGNVWRNNCHNINLDVGADTFEEAIIKLARKVQSKYPLKKYGKLYFAAAQDDQEKLTKKFGKEKGWEKFVELHPFFKKSFDDFD